MRALVLFMAGVVCGTVLTVACIHVGGGWYVYRTLPIGECQAAPMNAEVVPNQPNPCNFRRPRWPFPS